MSRWEGQEGRVDREGPGVQPRMAEAGTDKEQLDLEVQAVREDRHGRQHPVDLEVQHRLSGPEIRSEIHLRRKKNPVRL